MSRGGARPGAGRKVGSVARKTRELRWIATEAGVTPLEVMLEAMRAHYKAQRLDEAAAIAKDAAPYIHPRLSSVEYQRKEKPVEELGDIELERIARSGGNGASAPASDEAKPPRVVH